jgi:hypothetical protein
MRLGLLLTALATLLVACNPPDPLKSLQRELESFPEYSVILHDMRQSGNFSPTFEHQYQIVTGSPQTDSEELSYRQQVTDWQQVSKDTFQRYQELLGMTILSKGPDGEVSSDNYPPGYQYVGNERYGTWRTDNRGTSFWEFYGQYAFFNALWGGLSGRSVFQNDFDTYRDTRRRGSPYLGPNNEYGTRGTRTQQTNPTFFERQQARQSAGRSRFGNTVRNRVNRSSGSNFRNRSGGFGK